MKSRIGLLYQNSLPVVRVPMSMNCLISTQLTEAMMIGDVGSQQKLNNQFATSTNLMNGTKNKC